MKKIFAVLGVLFLLALSACGSNTNGFSVGSNDDGSSSDSSYLTQLASGLGTIIGIFNASGTSQTVGSAGGAIEVTNVLSQIKGAKIVIPSGALNNDTVISLNVINNTNALPENATSGGVVIDFRPDGTIFNKNIFITMPYNDADNDGFVDNTDIPENQLSVMYWDNSSQTWILVDNIISIDTANNTITFETNHFTPYTTAYMPVPKGTIQGVVRDSCTLMPIERAVVDIGIARATTDANGLYTLANVPATTYNAKTGDSGWRGYYTATIGMTNAKIDGVPVTNYALTYYDRLEVKFTSLGTGSAIVEGINYSEAISIGKLGSTITGKAVFATTYQPVPAGFTVYLINRETTSTNTSGNVGNIVMSTLTDSDGSFAWTGVENNQTFGLYITDNVNLALATYLAYGEISTVCNMPIPVGLIKVNFSDGLCPFVAETSPINGTAVKADTGTAGLNISIIFSKVIKATAYNTGNSLTASSSGLYGDISVVYLGNNTAVTHSLSWNTEMTKLIINIPDEALSPGSAYAVKIKNNRYLTDANGNPLSFAPDINGSFECSSSGTNLGTILQFNTY